MKPIWRIAFDEPSDPDADHLVLRLDMQWDGQLRANTSVVYTSAHETLGEAYEDERCLFRETLPFPPDRLAELLEDWPDQVLAYNPIGPANQQIVRHIASPVGDGTFVFDNAEVADSRIRLSLIYPYPRNLRAFFVRFGRYRVIDGAEITLTLPQKVAANPRAFPFLPPGRQREFAEVPFRSNELRVTLGAGGTTLSEGDGVVLYWTEV